MITPRWVARLGIWPWLVGALLSTVAMILGHDLGNETAELLGGEPGIGARLGKGLVWGGVIAGLQWPVVRAAGVPPVRFLVAGALGLAVGYPLGQTIQLLLVQQWSMHWAGYWSGVATFGLSPGVPQWWLLRRHLNRASLWMAFSLTGWMLTGLVWINGGRGGVEYGVVTGLGLVWLARSPRQSLAGAGDGSPWWRGARGEWLVVGQLLLMGLVFFGPRTVLGHPAWVFPFPRACPAVGGVLMVAGGALLLAGLIRLGPGLTPLPFPKEGADLVQTGPFALVRHPMYSGGLVLAVGWALYVQGWLTLGYVVALFVFLDAKSRREERWLAEKFPTYAAYQLRVRKLVPFIY